MKDNDYYPPESADQCGVYFKWYELPLIVLIAVVMLPFCHSIASTS